MPWRWPFNLAGCCSVYSGTAVHSYTVNCLRVRYFPVSSATKLPRPEHQPVGSPTYETNRLVNHSMKTEKSWAENIKVYHHNTTMFYLLCILSFSTWIIQVLIYTPIVYHPQHLCSLSCTSEKSEESHLSNNAAKPFCLICKIIIHFQYNNGSIMWEVHKH